jgi:hypothetical protein
LILTVSSETFLVIRELITKQEFKISEHGLQEMIEDSLSVRDVVFGIGEGKVVEDYPEFGKGPCVLVLQRTPDGHPLHVLWGLHKDTSRPAVLITAYKPDGMKWNEDYTRRQP